MTKIAPDDAARLRARERPRGRAVMYQTWDHLLFLHWKVEPDVLTPLLPPGLHLDTYDHKAWLGVVPFFMKGVRPAYCPPVPGISNFLELNVRTYVYNDQGIPGVWFFSLDASSRLACALARWRFHLPYRDAKMKAGVGEWVDYSALRYDQSETATYRYRGSGESHTATPGTLEFFLLERYVLFAYDQKRGNLGCRFTSL